MRKIIVATILIGLTFTLISCAKWRVDNLTPTLMAFVENGTEVGNVNLAIDDHALREISFGVFVHRNKIITTDNNLRRVQVLSGNSKPELIIGNVRDIDPTEYNISNFNFGSIGHSVMDSSDRIYIQNRLTQSNQVTRGETSFAPSFILMFDKNGRLLSTIGRGGTVDLPFSYIDSLTIDDRNRLIVVSRSFDNWSIYRFTDTRRDYFFDFGTLNFRETHGKDVFIGRIEAIRPYHNKDAVLISVAYYFENRLKHRTIYSFSMSNNQLEKPTIEIQNPKNSLFAIASDKSLYLWNMDGRRVKFLEMNNSGGILNNLGVDFNSGKYYYVRLFTGRQGDIYSFHVDIRGISIYKWD